jgi:hypothetical protein
MSTRTRRYPDTVDSVDTVNPAVKSTSCERTPALTLCDSVTGCAVRLRPNFTVSHSVKTGDDPINLAKPLISAPNFWGRLQRQQSQQCPPISSLACADAVMPDGRTRPDDPSTAVLPIGEAFSHPVGRWGDLTPRLRWLRVPSTTLTLFAELPPLSACQRLAVEQLTERVRARLP